MPTDRTPIPGACVVCGVIIGRREAVCDSCEEWERREMMRDPVYSMLTISLLPLSLPSIEEAASLMGCKRRETIRLTVPPIDETTPPVVDSE